MTAIHHLLSCDATGLAPGWDRVVAEELGAELGDVTVLVLGSRALGTADAASDCDLAIVDSLWRVAWLIPRLPSIARRLTAELGVPVSLNPIPRRHLARGHSLYLQKVRAEAVVVRAAPGFALEPQGRLHASKFAGASYVLSAIVAVLEAIRPLAPGREADPELAHAIRKAVRYVAQLRLLDRGEYATTLEAALLDLGDTDLTAIAEDAVGPDALDRIRMILLAETRRRPLTMTWWRIPARNAQFAVIAAMRGRPRWRAAVSPRSAEVDLAHALVELLRAIDVAAPFCALSEAWYGRRDAVVTSWHDAHPLAGLLT